MSFIRPEAFAFLTRWAETAFSALVFAVMLWVGGWMVWGGSIMGLFILVVAVGGGFWFWTALARARLAQSPPGPGVVIVDERRITYMGPETGAFLALDALTRIEIATGSAGLYAASPSWVLRGSEGEPLVIPAGASGADNLLEAFAALPGFSYDKVVAAMAAPAETRSLVWRRAMRSPASALASRAAPD